MTDSRNMAKIVRFPRQAAGGSQLRFSARERVLEALEECLEARRTGEDLAGVLARHPEHREELLALLAVTGRVAASAERARRMPLPPLRLSSLTQPRPPTRIAASPPLLRLTTLASVGVLWAAPFLDLNPWLTGPALWTAMLSWLAWWLDSRSTQRPEAGPLASRRGDVASA